MEGSASVVSQGCCSNFLIIATAEGVFACGENQKGQLGIGRKSESVPNPTKVPDLKSKDVSQIATGWRHSAVLLKTGKVLVCGDNRREQLGFVGRSWGRFRELCDESIEEGANSVVCGADFTAVLSQGRCVVFGVVFKNWKRRKIALRLLAKQIYCGDLSTIVLSVGLNVYYCGSNGKCQLGLPKQHKVDTPVAIEHFGPKRIIPISFSLGAKHSVCKAADSFYVFSNNSHGQLNISSKLPEIQEVPLGVHDLLTSPPGMISCSGSLTVIVAEDGTIFTIGNNSAGQLGHGNKSQFTGPVTCENGIFNPRATGSQMDGDADKYVQTRTVQLTDPHDAATQGVTEAQQPSTKNDNRVSQVGGIHTDVDTKAPSMMVDEPREVINIPFGREIGYVVAARKFIASSVDELSFDEGDVISVVEVESDDGRPIGTLGEDLGKFPWTFVRPLEQSSKKTELTTTTAVDDPKLENIDLTREVFAISRFAHDSNKKGYLSFEKNETMRILDFKNGKGWWLAEYNNEIGYIPSNYFDIWTDGTLIDRTSHLEAGIKWVRAERDYTGFDGIHIPFKAGDIIMITSSDDSGLVGSHNGSFGYVLQNFVTEYSNTPPLPQQRPPETLPPRNDPIKFAKVRLKYLADTSGEIDLEIGDEVSIFEEREDGWCVVEFGGRRGLVPTIFLEEIDNLTTFSGYSSSEASDGDPPDDLCCPLTFDLFSDPVIAEDGITYERSEIIEWLKANGTSPTAGIEMFPRKLRKDKKMLRLVYQWKKSHPKRH